MKIESKYPTLNLEEGQYYVYVHTVTTEQGLKLYYIGMSQMQPARRWQPSQYKRSSLGSYIEKYGWDNINHQVLEVVNDKRSAETLEDILIHSLSVNGMVINKYRSGGHARDNLKEYMCKRYEEHKDEIREYQREYQQSEQGKAAHRKYRQSEQGKAVKRKANAKHRAKPEWKIYYRVHNYNQTHTPIETPMEAKQRYLNEGIIPNYIKHDDI